MALGKTRGGHRGPWLSKISACARQIRGGAGKLYRYEARGPALHAPNHEYGESSIAQISVRPAGAKVKAGTRAPIREPREEPAPGEQQDESDAPEAPSSSQDSPLLDLTDAAVKRMIKAAKTRGYVTYDELNSVLPSEQVSSAQIEDTMAMLTAMGINVVDSEEGG